jgi:hypothetical protein
MHRNARDLCFSAVPALAAGLVLCAGAAYGETRAVPVVYRGTQPAEPASIPFQVGDRLTITARPGDLGRQLVSRSVRVEGTIHYYERTDTHEREKSCGPFDLFSCTEEIHQKIYASQPVLTTTATQYSPFLQVGPALQFVTAAGAVDFLLQGQDNHPREVLASGGYVYVALHEGRIATGKLVLPANSFDTGSATATPDEVRWGREWVQGKCAGKPECTVVGEPTITVSRGNIELQMLVEINHP